MPASTLSHHNYTSMAVNSLSLATTTYTPLGRLLSLPTTRYTPLACTLSYHNYTHPWHSNRRAELGITVNRQAKLNWADKKLKWGLLSWLKHVGYTVLWHQLEGG